MKLPSFIAPCIVLCLGFVLKAELITHHSFGYCWAVLTVSRLYLFPTLPPPSQSQEVEGGQKFWKGHNLGEGSEWAVLWVLGCRVNPQHVPMHTHTMHWLGQHTLSQYPYLGTFRWVWIGNLQPRLVLADFKIGFYFFIAPRTFKPISFLFICLFVCD